MRAFAVRSFGEAPAVHDLPIPAADGGILIRVRYAGVNPIDYKLVERLTTTSAFPFVVGVDFAGVVQRVPMGEPDLGAGDRVFGMARTHGAYAEYTAIAPGVQAEALARIPDGVTDEQAAALPIAAITALGSVDMLDVSARPSAATSTELAASAPTRSTTPQPGISSKRFPYLTPRASTRSSTWSTTRTPSAATPRFSSPAAASSRRFMRQTKVGLPSATSRRTTFRRPPIPCHRRKGSAMLRACSRTGRSRRGSAPRSSSTAQASYSTNFATLGSEAKRSSASRSEEVRRVCAKLAHPAHRPNTVMAETQYQTAPLQGTVRRPRAARRRRAEYPHDSRTQ
jgi:Alcohol dehydrogenase GroES-like domain